MILEGDSNLSSSPLRLATPVSAVGCMLFEAVSRSSLRCCKVVCRKASYVAGASMTTSSTTASRATMFPTTTGSAYFPYHIVSATQQDHEHEASGTPSSASSSLALSSACPALFSSASIYSLNRRVSAKVPPRPYAVILGVAYRRAAGEAPLHGRPALQRRARHRMQADEDLAPHSALLRCRAVSTGTRRLQAP